MSPLEPSGEVWESRARIGCNAHSVTEGVNSAALILLMTTLCNFPDTGGHSSPA